MERTPAAVAVASAPSLVQRLRALAPNLGWLSFVVLCALAYPLQALAPLLMFALSMSTAIGLFMRGHKTMKQRFAPWLVTDRSGSARLRELGPALLGCVFWLASAWFLSVHAVRAQLGEVDYFAFGIALPWLLTALRVSCELRPRRRQAGAVRALTLALVTLLVGRELVHYYAGPEEPLVDLSLPVRGAWAVMQGGRAVSFNHHYAFVEQRHALDLIALPELRADSVRAERVEDFASWDRQLVSPVTGRIERAVGDRRDMRLGETDSEVLEGNHLIIRAAAGFYVLLAHLRQGSLLVRAGDEVQAGQPIARVGNSGNTSEPHLHLQVQTRPDLWASDNRTLPLRFIASQGERAPSRAPRRNDVLVGSSPK